jgi:hypothetical protein
MRHAEDFLDQIGKPTVNPQAHPFSFLILGRYQFQHMLTELSECAHRFLREASKYGEVGSISPIPFIRGPASRRGDRRLFSIKISRGVF